MRISKRKKSWNERDGKRLIEIRHWDWKLSVLPGVQAVLAQWKVKVENKTDKDIKDVQFKNIYYSESDTELDVGYETVYELFPAGKTRTVRYEEFFHSKATKAGTEIVKALWKY